MQLVPNTSAAPRLLNTAALDVDRAAAKPEEAASNHKLARSSIFSGNGRAIFLGLLVGSLAVAAAGYVFAQHHTFGNELEAVRKFFVVRTATVKAAPPPAEKKPPLTVQISPALLRVTAIALGHPRIAIINGQEVTEGDSITVRAPDRAISVTLQVVKISEAGIALTDGTHIVTTRLPVEQARVIPPVR
jgi:hypothetical protein